LPRCSAIEDPRELWRVLYSLPEILLSFVCGTMAECSDYEAIAAWGERDLLYDQEVPETRRLTLLMNRIAPALFFGLLHRLGTGADRSAAT
jgi:hypothetical protein